MSWLTTIPTGGIAAATLTGDDCRLFFDSVMVHETTALSRFASDASLLIGTSSHAADPRYEFTGALDHIRIYDRAFTASNVGALYSMERAHVPDPTSNLAYAVAGITFLAIHRRTWRR